MENKEHLIRNVDHARIAAEGEKPLRDIAREEWANSSEKSALDVLAETRGEEILNEYLKQDTSQEVSTDKERFEMEIVEQIIDYIQKSPNLQFIAFGSGKISENSPSKGHYGYLFDYQAKEMVQINDDADLNLDHKVSGREDVPFQPQYDILKGKRYTYLTIRVPLRVGAGGNPLGIDPRRGTHLTVAIRYDAKNFALNNKEIENLIKDPTANFVDKVVFGAAQKFIPEYYGYVSEMARQRKG